ncbi:MAG TPA: SAM-dependent methyltransferase [Planctomycetota bacterium]|nr:SAM-dependent methyltransferase [Planctomycetota bacterium]
MRGAPLVRDVADTARWVAAYRALESERPGAHFHDPLARRLAGERGFEIVASVPRLLNEDWALTARTVLIDEIIMREVASGVDTVLDLGAGLDTRPYRLALPRDLLWVEVDQEPLLREKEERLEGERPVCSLERVALDLSREDERRGLFARLGATRKRVLVLTEGLLIYLRPEDVTALGRELAAAGFSRWLLDVGSPGLVRVFMRRGRTFLDAAPMRFGPAEGVSFFEPLGWRSLEVHSKLKAAARLGRLGVLLRLASLLPDPGGRNLGIVPWSGVCLLERK